MSKKENIEHELRIKITKVKVLSFVISEVSENNQEKDELVFNTRIHLDFDSQLRSLKILVVVKSYTVDEETFSEIKVENVFEYESSTEFLQDNDGFEFPRFVLDRLVENSISNVRGILVEKFKGTKYQNQIMPLISFSNFEKE
ncbi:hypothetical protein ACKLNQ_02500 [Myroides odoratimimus]|uniref:hypothetical protein n=1 Tax=Myroides odoratimimus TaxID=76832 RepID=UPI0038D3C358